MGFTNFWFGDFAPKSIKKSEKNWKSRISKIEILRFWLIKSLPIMQKSCFYVFRKIFDFLKFWSLNLYFQNILWVSSTISKKSKIRISGIFDLRKKSLKIELRIIFFFKLEIYVLISTGVYVYVPETNLNDI